MLTTTDAMATNAAGPAETSAAVAALLLQAIVDRDEDTLRELFRDDVWLRAMLVREVVERHDAAGAVDAFRGWFGGAHEIEVLDLGTYTVTTREHVTYRLRLRPDWAPDVWHVIEQSGYVRVRDGKVSRLDLVCTGFTPEPSLDAPPLIDRVTRS